MRVSEISPEKYIKKTIVKYVGHNLLTKLTIIFKIQEKRGYLKLKINRGFSTKMET